MAGICNITQGRKLKCKDRIGGVKSVYIAPYKKVLRNELQIINGEIINFPVTFIYEFSVLGNVNFTESESKSDGGLSQEISLTLNFKNINAFDNSRFQKMLNRDYFIVILDNNGNYFLAGLRNGLTCIDLKSGSNDIYNITFNGQEIEKSLYCKQLVTSGILIPIDKFNYIFENNNNRIFQNNNKHILQNG